jgi:sugar phosphate isomerase/epimerase
VNGTNAFLSSRAGGQADRNGIQERVNDRLGLNVPYEWWPRAAALKAIEATGFKWIQVASPPIEMLADPRHVIRHGQALRRSLEMTELRPVVHGPGSLRLGTSLHDRAGEGLVEYAHQIGASHVVYHALDVPKHGAETEREEHSLRRLARWAEVLGVVICLENLCPVYPGEPRVCHDPAAVRALVQSCESSAVGMVFDLGHANVVADREGTGVAALLAAVLDVVSLFHVHDNLGARRRNGGGLRFDPLRLDLHLPPGIGTLPWESIAAMLSLSPAPLVMEIHPSHRPPAAALADALRSVVFGEPAADVSALETVPNFLA